MISMLHYGLDAEGIRIDVPQYAFDAASAKTEYFSHLLYHPQLEHVIEMDSGPGGVELLLNTERLGHLQEGRWRQDRARAMTYVAMMASAYTAPEDRDPDIPQLVMSLDPLGDGQRFGMEASINRWTAPYHEAEDETSQAMGRIAVQLGLVSERIRSQSVYARVDTARGVTLETNPIGSCSLDTDGQEYDPRSPVVHLYGHNIPDRNTQLVLLGGVVALAHA